jgi:hypothetical protein
LRWLSLWAEGRGGRVRGGRAGVEDELRAERPRRGEDKERGSGGGGGAAIATVSSPTRRGPERGRNSVLLLFVWIDSVNLGSRSRRRGEAGRVRAGSAPCALLCPSGNLFCALVVRALLASRRFVVVPALLLFRRLFSALSRRGVQDAFVRR